MPIDLCHGSHASMGVAEASKVGYEVEHTCVHSWAGEYTCETVKGG